MVQITCFISFLPLPSGLFPSQCNLNGGEQACKGAANEPSQTPCPWSTMQLPSLGRTVFPSCRKSTNPSQNSAWNQVLVNHVGGPIDRWQGQLVLIDEDQILRRRNCALKPRQKFGRSELTDHTPSWIGVAVTPGSR